LRGLANVRIDNTSGGLMRLNGVAVTAGQWSARLTLRQGVWLYTGAERQRFELQRFTFSGHRLDRQL
jgi:hypothetical protein